jgi:hypothetical protein
MRAKAPRDWRYLSVEKRKMKKGFTLVSANALLLYMANVALLSICIRSFVHEGFLGLAFLFGIPLLVLECFITRRRWGTQATSPFLLVLAFLILVIWLGSQIGHLR